MQIFTIEESHGLSYLLSLGMVERGQQSCPDHNAKTGCFPQVTSTGECALSWCATGAPKLNTDFARIVELQFAAGP